MSMRLRELSVKRELKVRDVRNPVVTGKGRTKQEFKAECDINNIIRRYAREGFLRHMARGVPEFLDVSEIGDFRTAVDQVREAERWFSLLPAKIRTKFGDDAARFLDEAGQMSRAELRELGLAELRKSDAPIRRRADDVEEPAPPKGGAGS